MHPSFLYISIFLARDPVLDQDVQAKPVDLAVVCKAERENEQVYQTAAETVSQSTPPSSPTCDLDDAPLLTS